MFKSGAKVGRSRRGWCGGWGPQTTPPEGEAPSGLEQGLWFRAAEKPIRELSASHLKPR